MKQFNVLDRHLSIHRPYLLEASAGTGKTFSIQNIVVRLLVESSEKQAEPLLINQILVMTFTRAATRDLKVRIRSNLEQAVQYLNDWMHETFISSSMPDYLLAVIDEGIDAVRRAKKRLQQALFAFDQAQIFTIHSFCSRMLRQYAIESDMGFHAEGGEKALPPSEVMAVIRDFFHTGLRPESYSVGQLAIILKEDPEQSKLLRAIQSGYDFIKSPPFSELHGQFCGSMRELKDALGLHAEQMLEDFKAQYGSYRNYKSGETKAEMLEKIVRFTALFNQDTWSAADFDTLLKDGLVWVHALDPDLLKANAPTLENLFYLSLTEQLKIHLEGLIRQAGSFPVLLSRLARDCQELLRRYQREEEKLSPDDLLRKMDWALSHPHFLANIQSAYQAAIIDEFQDTDPLQWKIFSRLFIPENRSWEGYLYLVGDPKQAIYSFRQADIYTYLSAAQALGKQCCFSLDTNYRSQPSLVQALNTLFDIRHAPRLIPLPKMDFHLPYQPVHSSDKIAPQDFQDERGAVHFFIADGKAFKKATLHEMESKVFFPFIAEEIKALVTKSGLHYRQLAVLVRDRYQALRLAEFFAAHQIPYLSQRGTSLAESPALPALVDAIRAVLHPHDIRIVKAALGGPLIAWTHGDFKSAEQLEEGLILIQKLRQCLVEHGFSYFFEELLQSHWQSDGLAVIERMLRRENGLDFYHDLQQIADIVVDHQYQDWNGPEGIVPFLDQFYVWETNEDERVKRFQDPDKDGVKILTLHVSKGLEFDIVFALGLVNRVGAKDELIPVEKEGKLVLAPLIESRSVYRPYFEEMDAEKMRQLYVAMTRAKYRLYLPVALHLAYADIELGDASPMDLFLARLGQSSVLSYEEIYQQIRSFNGLSLTQFIETVGRHHSITHSVHQAIEQRKEESKDRRESFFLEPPKEVSIPGEDLFLTSFSGLARPSVHSLADVALPHNFDNELKTRHTLPAGSDTGFLLHTLFEKLDFQDFQILSRPEEALLFVRPYLQRPAFKPWEQVIASLTFNALKTPLAVGEQTFCLADVKHMYKEMPFIFPFDQSFVPEEMSVSKGFIKGVIDLIIGYQDKYYIIDWKSNWLGNEQRAYESSHLHAAMSDRQYFLQAELYTEALRRYLSIVESRLFEKCFGGVIYLFLRGLQIGDQTGIYHFLPQLALR